MEAIKTWEFSERNDPKTTVKLFMDHVEMKSPFYNNVHSFTIDQFFCNPYPVGNLQVDYELLKYLVIISDRNTMSDASKLVYDFYTAFDNSKIKPVTIEQDSKAGDFVRYFSSLTVHGISKYYEREDGDWIQSSQRFFDFFFFGPEIPKLSLGIRKSWRDQVFKALGDHPPFALTEGFVLFDYNKITPKNFTYNSPDKDEGEYFNIERDQISSGGWSGRDGGGNSRSLEQVWYFENSILTSMSSHKPEIRKILEAAILEGRKTTEIRPVGKIEENPIFDIVEPTDKTVKKTDAPAGEAPPA